MAEVIDKEILDDLNGKFLTFYIADAIYGIELLHVIEIIGIQPITTVPFVPAFAKGIINLRGKIVPVIDVRLKFGMEPKEYDDKTCIIVVDINNMHVGIIVDGVSEVVTVDSSHLSQLPESGGSGANKYLHSVSKINNRVILNIDCDKFFEIETAV